MLTVFLTKCTILYKTGISLRHWSKQEVIYFRWIKLWCVCVVGAVFLNQSLTNLVSVDRKLLFHDLVQLC